MRSAVDLGCNSPPPPPQQCAGFTTLAHSINLEALQRGLQSVAPRSYAAGIPLRDGSTKDIFCALG